MVVQIRIGIVTFGSVLQPRGGLPARSRAASEDISMLGARVGVLSFGERHDGTINSGGSDVPVTAIHSRAPYGLSARLALAARRLAADSDALIVESALLLPAVVAGRPRVPIIWDTNECETLHYRRAEPSASNRVKELIWTVLERWAAGRAAAIVAVSATEAEVWRTLLPGHADRVVVADHRPLLGSVASREQQFSDSPPEVTFVGNLGGKHNLSAAQWTARVLPQELRGPARIVLAGPGTETIEPVPAPGVEVLCAGEVDDLAGLLSRAAICVAPLDAGAGVKTKVLDYLAAGTRIAGTPTAFEGFEHCPGLVQASLQDLPAVIQQMIDNPETAEEAIHRRTAQRAWLDGRGPGRTAEQWRRILAGIGIPVISRNRSSAEQIGPVADPLR